MQTYLVKCMQGERIIMQTTMVRPSRSVHWEAVEIPKSEPHTFMTQKRAPFHHFVNFAKFSSAGLGIVYVVQQLVAKIQEK